MTFKTVKNQSEGTYTERKSKFIAKVFPISSEEEVKAILKELRKKYFDARHIAYAFKIGLEKPLYRYSDDGEPNNTAGLPIFGVIEKNKITNVLIAVIRYFGGKKLGVSGLINAYRTAAENGLLNNQIIEKQVAKTQKLNFHYSELNKVMNFLKKNQIKILKQEFSENCYLEIEFPIEKEETILQFINKLKTEKQ